MQNNLHGKVFALRLGFFWSNFKSGYLNLKNDSILLYSNPKAKSEFIESFIILDSVDSTRFQKRVQVHNSCDGNLISFSEFDCKIIYKGNFSNSDWVSFGVILNLVI